MHINVYLVAPSLGLSKVYVDVWPDDLYESREDLIHGIDFQYFENNYACDHNRALFMNLPNNDDNTKYNCVSNIVKIEKITEVLADGSEVKILDGDLDEESDNTRSSLLDDEPIN